MDMAILLHDGLCWTYPTSICHVHPHDTTRLVGRFAALFTGSFLASGLYCAQAESGPAHLRLTRAVRRLRQVRNLVYFYIDTIERMFYNLVKKNYHEKENHNHASPRCRPARRGRADAGLRACH